MKIRTCHSVKRANPLSHLQQPPWLASMVIPYYDITMQTWFLRHMIKTRPLNGHDCLSLLRTTGAYWQTKWGQWSLPDSSQCFMHSNEKQARTRLAEQRISIANLYLSCIVKSTCAHPFQCPRMWWGWWNLCSSCHKPFPFLLPSLYLQLI